jgi:isopenicillin N synthase-like dioxygenase
MPGAKRGVPVVDLSDFDARRDEIQQQLLHAAEEIGFLQVVNHGVPQQLIDSMFALSEGFFALPDDVKAKYPFAGWNAGWEKMKQIRQVHRAELPPVPAASQLKRASMHLSFPAGPPPAPPTSRSRTRSAGARAWRLPGSATRNAPASRPGACSS